MRENYQETESCHINRKLPLVTVMVNNSVVEGISFLATKQSSLPVGSYKDGEEELGFQGGLKKQMRRTPDTFSALSHLQCITLLNSLLLHFTPSFSRSPEDV